MRDGRRCSPSSSCETAGAAVRVSGRQARGKGLVAQGPLIADLHPQCIEEQRGVEGVEGPVQPSGHLLQDKVATTRMRSGERSMQIELAQVPLDLANRHAPRLERNHLFIDIRKAPAILGDQLWLEGACRPPAPAIPLGGNRGRRSRLFSPYGAIVAGPICRVVKLRYLVQHRFPKSVRGLRLG